nr:hypothetical protein Itr_chr01CG11490 [Ipomoea trifida]
MAIFRLFSTTRSPWAVKGGPPHSSAGTGEKCTLLPTFAAEERNAGRGKTPLPPPTMIMRHRHPPLTIAVEVGEEETRIGTDLRKRHPRHLLPRGLSPPSGVAVYRHRTSLTYVELGGRTIIVVFCSHRRHQLAGKTREKRGEEGEKGCGWVSRDRSCRGLRRTAMAIFRLFSTTRSPWAVKGGPPHSSAGTGEKCTLLPTFAAEERNAGRGKTPLPPPTMIMRHRHPPLTIAVEVGEEETRIGTDLRKRHPRHLLPRGLSPPSGVAVYRHRTSLTYVELGGRTIIVVFCSHRRHQLAGKTREKSGLDSAPLSCLDLTKTKEKTNILVFRPSGRCLRWQDWWSHHWRRLTVVRRQLSRQKMEVREDESSSNSWGDVPEEFLEEIKLLSIEIGKENGTEAKANLREAIKRARMQEIEMAKTCQWKQEHQKEGVTQREEDVVKRQGVQAESGQEGRV